MQATEQRQPISQKNQVGFDKNAKKHLKRTLNWMKSISEFRKSMGFLFFVKKALRTSVEELKDQNKNEKNIDKERKNVLQ